MSLSDRLSTTEELLDSSADFLETPHDPISFDEGRWASGTRNRRGWIADEYERMYGTPRPSDFNVRLNDDIMQTYGTRYPWDDATMQDFPGETKSEWMSFKPADRHGSSINSTRPTTSTGAAFTAGRSKWTWPRRPAGPTRGTRARK